MEGFDSIIFDLDGTLWDTFGLRRTLEQRINEERHKFQEDYGGRCSSGDGLAS